MSAFHVAVTFPANLYTSPTSGAHLDNFFFSSRFNRPTRIQHYSPASTMMWGNSRKDAAVSLHLLTLNILCLIRQRIWNEYMEKRRKIYLKSLLVTSWVNRVHRAFRYLHGVAWDAGHADELNDTILGRNSESWNKKDRPSTTFCCCQCWNVEESRRYPLPCWHMPSRRNPSAGPC